MIEANRPEDLLRADADVPEADAEHPSHHQSDRKERLQQVPGDYHCPVEGLIIAHLDEEPSGRRFQQPVDIHPDSKNQVETRFWRKWRPQSGGSREVGEAVLAGQVPTCQRLVQAHHQLRTTALGFALRRSTRTGFSRPM
jgi:hypothetical protein